MKPIRNLALTLVAGLLAVPASMGDEPKDKSNVQQAKSFEKDITINVKMNYLLYLPKGYEGTNDSKKWPLILFLHGAGESGSDLEKVKLHGPPKLVATKDYPFIIVSPQSSGRG